jgi:glycosyltransferase involved in cell wall biosynthesis
MFSSLSALIFARLHGTACVLVPHESLTEFDVHKKGSSTRVVAKQLLKRIYLRYCDLIIAGSNVEAAESMRAGAKAQYLVMWYPLVDDHHPPRPRRRWSSMPTFTIGYLGRIDPKKNIDVLLRALALLPQSFSLVVGGDGPEKLKRTLTSLASELGIEKRIVWRGFVNAAGKDEFFDSIDVLAMPSQFESFGIVAVESMMRGVPVILSPTTGVAELVDKHGGGLVIPPTPESLAQVFEGLSHNPVAMEAMSSQGIWVTNEYLSFTRAGSQLRDKYIELVNEVRPQAFARSP